MVLFKLENYEITADVFTFPNNSTSFSDSSEFEFQQTNVPFDNKHIFITKGSLKPKTLSLQGYFSGSEKETNYNNLLKKCSSPNLKKFYFDSDKFYIVLSPQFKKTKTGGRNNFLDYVGSFVTPIPFVFSDTQKISIYDGSWTNGTAKNEGSHKTFIEEIEVVFSGSGNSETFSIQDGHNGGITINDIDHDSGDKIIIKLITMIDSNGYKTTEYWYATFYDDSAGTTTQIQRATASNRSELDLVLEPEEQVNELTFIDSTISNYTTIIRWRDSWI